MAAGEGDWAAKNSHFAGRKKKTHRELSRGRQTKEVMTVQDSYYVRQVQAQHFGLAQQKRLEASSVLILGLGGVGSAAALYLASAGISRVGLVDSGRVKESNLHRQILYTPGDLGQSKPRAAKEELTRRRPDLQCLPYAIDVENQLQEIDESYDLLLDCLDNVQPRLAAASFAYEKELISISGGAKDWEGFLLVSNSKKTACFACLYGGLYRNKEPYPSPGIMGACAGMVGTLQAAFSMRCLTEENPFPRGKFLSLDVRHGQAQEITLDKNPSCPVCGQLR